MMGFNWKQLQNGSDIRGVALEGVPNQPVNLDEKVVGKLAKAFFIWLKKAKSNSKTLRVAVGMDSRLTGPALKRHLLIV